jgi:hypothetical protein
MPAHHQGAAGQVRRMRLSCFGIVEITYQDLSQVSLRGVRIYLVTFGNPLPPILGMFGRPKLHNPHNLGER